MVTAVCIVGWGFVIYEVGAGINVTRSRSELTGNETTNGKEPAVDLSNFGIDFNVLCKDEDLGKIGNRSIASAFREWIVGKCVEFARFRVAISAKFGISTWCWELAIFINT